MDRLSDWRAAAWLAFCLAAVAAVAALLVPAAVHRHPLKAKPVLRATLVPRTHLFGQQVNATLEVPAGLTVTARFTPYRILQRTVTRTGRTVRYEFALDCLSTRCIGPPGAERQLLLPPVQIKLRNGHRLLGFWPPLRQASRLSPHDLSAPQLRGELAAPPGTGGDGRLTGILLAIGAALALAAAGALGLRWLAWRPQPVWAVNGRRKPSALDYALLITGLAAGGGPQDRRTALESLAVALEERGLGDLAAEARRLAWGQPSPGSESVRALAAAVQEKSKGKA